MPSVVDVANRALDKLGHGAITSLTDGTKAASLVERTWPIVRNHVLRSHPWNFAVKRASLSPLTETPAWGFSYQHQLPDGLLRLLEVLDLSMDEYQIEGNKLLCDESVVYIRYIDTITDPNEFDALFTNYLATALAFELCETLTQSNTKKNLLVEELKEVMLEAKRTDAVENPPVSFEEDSWVEARY